MPPCLAAVRVRFAGGHLSVARLSANSVSMNLHHAAALALVGWYLMATAMAIVRLFTHKGGMLV